MKKLITRTFIIIILIFTIYGFKDKVYGKVCDGGWTLIQLMYAKADGLTAKSTKTTLGSRESILSILNKCDIRGTNGDFFEEDTLTNHLMIKSTVKVTGPVGGMAGCYNVYLGDMFLGEMPGDIQKNQNLAIAAGAIPGEYIIKYLGYDGDTTDFMTSDIENISWDVILEVNIPEKGTTDNGTPNAFYSTESYKLYSAEVEKVYSGDDMKNAKPELEEKVEIFDEPEEETGLIETAVGWNQTLNSWITNPIENIVSLLLDLVKLIFGDVPQIFANFIQTGFESNGISNLKISFKPSELKGRNQDSPTNPNAYIKFEEGTSTDKHFEGQEVITIPLKPKTIEKNEEEENEDQTYGFNEDSKIPLISVDLFTLAGNKVQMVDVNFLDIRNNQNDSWLYIRNFIASIVHAAMYITIGILILVLIWNAILIVKDSINGANAESARRHKEVLEKLAKAVVMLVGTLILEALLIYGSQMFLGEIGKIGGDTYEGPIRVVVQDDIYTFSTTPTGYIRYMADISNIKLNTTKAMYVGIYILLAWSNLLFLIIMMIRMILMMLLAVVGFIIVIMYIIENNGTAMHKYKSWISIYASLAVIQIVMGILFKIIMEVAVK